MELSKNCFDLKKRTMFKNLIISGNSLKYYDILFYSVLQVLEKI